MDPFTDPVAGELKRFEARLDGALRADVELAHEIARYMATLRGKRLRPTLALLGARAAGGWDERVVEAAAAVEMIHAATMIHDDVVDSAAMRRGKQSVNAAWSDQLAVLMGDFLLARALCMLVELGDLQALRVVSSATQRLSVGEIFEIQIGRQCDTRSVSYFSMVSDKTASLIAASACIGPILVGADARIVAAMADYGEALGQAFQIADDVLDLTGNAGTMGKPVGHDLRQGKITLPLIHALDAAPAGERLRLEEVLRRPHKSDADWQAIVGFVESHDGVERASATAREHASRAQECLRVLPPSPARESLGLAARLVVERES